jgi:hypothetical protein
MNKNLFLSGSDDVMVGTVAALATSGILKTGAGAGLCGAGRGDGSGSGLRRTFLVVATVEISSQPADIFVLT